MFLVEQTGIGSRNMVFNKIADVLDLDDLVLERAEEITIARAMRLGLPFINASKNVNIIRIDISLVMMIYSVCGHLHQLN